MTRPDQPRSCRRLRDRQPADQATTRANTKPEVPASSRSRRMASSVARASRASNTRAAGEAGAADRAHRGRSRQEQCVGDERMCLWSDHGDESAPTKLTNCSPIDPSAARASPGAPHSLSGRDAHLVGEAAADAAVKRRGDLLVATAKRLEPRLVEGEHAASRQRRHGRGRRHARGEGDVADEGPGDDMRDDLVLDRTSVLSLADEGQLRRPARPRRSGPCPARRCAIRRSAAAARSAPCRDRRRSAR